MKEKNNKVDNIFICQILATSFERLRQFAAMASLAPKRSSIWTNGVTKIDKILEICFPKPFAIK